VYKYVITLSLLFISMVITNAYSFDNNSPAEGKPMDVVANKKVFFGHQSVGENILHGLSLVDSDRGIKVIDIKDSAGKYRDISGFYHAKIGNNRSPESKINGFEKLVETYFNGDLDVAFLKLCYVDVTRDTAIAELFSHYQSALKRLKEKFPDIVFVHFTVPLTVSNTTWKTQLKQVLGQEDIWEYADNIKRNQYNQMVFEEYMGEEPIFDIATLEATHSDRSKEIFNIKGQDYHAMAKENSSDGGHLNDSGSKRVILPLIDLLAKL